MSIMILMVTYLALGVVESISAIDLNSVIALWLLDDGEGESVTDSSGNGHDGQIFDGVAPAEGKWTDENQFGQALEFDGAGDYIDFGNDESLKPQTLTITAWFSTRKLNSYGHIFQSGNDWNDMAGIVFRVHQDGNFQAAVTQGPGNNTSWVNGPALKSEQWYHAALTFDGEQLVLYLDGLQVAQTAGTQVHYDAKPVRIGVHSQDTGAAFDGFIDDVGYFSTALTQDEVVEVKELGLAEAVGLLSVTPHRKAKPLLGKTQGSVADHSWSGKLRTTWTILKQL